MPVKPRFPSTEAPGRAPIRIGALQPPSNRHVSSQHFNGGTDMNGVIYLVGLVVVVLFVLSILGLR